MDIIQYSAICVTCVLTEMNAFDYHLLTSAQRKPESNKRDLSAFRGTLRSVS